MTYACMHTKQDQRARTGLPTRPLPSGSGPVPPTHPFPGDPHTPRPVPRPVPGPDPLPEPPPAPPR